MDFKRVELSDKDWISPILRLEDSRSADFSFSNIYIWDRIYNQKVARLDDFLAVKICRDGKPYYAFPVGDGDLKKVVLALKEDSEKDGRFFCLRGALEAHVAALNDLFPGCFKLQKDTAVFDYVYLLSNLAELQGNMYHNKRNHISYFEGHNDWSFEPVSAENIRECAGLEEQWRSAEELDDTIAQEASAIERTIEHYFDLGMDGGLLRSAGKAIAFTIGDKLSSDTFLIHFEKAFKDIRGAYSMINREFARYIREKYPEMIYVNREEDMDIPGLRKSKLSYYPEFLVEKHICNYIYK